MDAKRCCVPSLVVAAVLGLGLVAWVSAAEPARTDYSARWSRDVVDTAQTSGFDTFAECIEKSGLKETLERGGPYTVFAPTDEAFRRLPAGELESLFDPQNKNKLRALVEEHVAMGIYHFKTLENISWGISSPLYSVQTLAGTPLTVKKEAKGHERLTVEGAEIVKPDIEASNGVIQGIDAVVTPQPPHVG